jgi:NAD(P)-dependent dehydrogenase (short-subunit alcohol dehydrogenase family)
MSDELRGLAIIVTGAGKGLGRAYACHAAAAGASVVVNDVDVVAARDTADFMKSNGGTALIDNNDISTWEGAEALVGACRAAYGTVNGLVNNAGVFYMADTWAADPMRSKRLIEINVLGPLFCTIAASRVMKENRGGCIVNAGSTGAAGLGRVAAYAASKGAITSLTFATANDLGTVGIRVNSIWPAAETPMLSEMVRTMQADGNQVRVEDLRKAGLKPSTTIAPLVTYLLSPLSEGVTGQAFYFDGRTLAVVVQTPYTQSPSVIREDGWDFAAVAAAINGPLAAHRQPYGPAGDLFKAVE